MHAFPVRQFASASRDVIVARVERRMCGQNGDRDQLHAMAYAQGSALMFGHTCFEERPTGLDFDNFFATNFD